MKVSILKPFIFYGICTTSCRGVVFWEKRYITSKERHIWTVYDLITVVRVYDKEALDNGISWSAKFIVRMMPLNHLKN